MKYLFKEIIYPPIKIASDGLIPLHLNRFPQIKAQFYPQKMRILPNFTWGRLNPLYPALSKETK